MSDACQKAIAERYRVAVRRFDALWDGSVSGAASEMGALLEELHQLEWVLFRCDRLCIDAALAHTSVHVIDKTLS